MKWFRKTDKGGKTAIKEKRDYHLLIYILPCIFYVVMFSYVPLGGWLLAFVDYKPGIPLLDSPFVGMKFFRIFLTEDLANVLRVMRNTVIFALLGYLTSPLSMILAISLNEVKNRGLRRIIQTVTTFPNFVSWVIVFALAFQFFSYDGVISHLLIDLGITEKPTSLLANNDAVYLFQCCMGLWKGLGWSSVVYLAAIAGIDQEEFDAAAIDGASRMQMIWYITIPSLMPTFLVLAIMGVGRFVGGGVDQQLMFYNGIVADHIETLDLYVYRATLLKTDYSYGTAIGILKSLVTIGLMFGVNRLAKRIRGENIF